jgi:hypothetical protein
MSVKSFCYLLLAIIMMTAFQCPRKMQKIMLSKIKFDYSKIDDHGLRNGEVAVDYEFCIPANETIVQEIRTIAPEMRVMKNSKGRIGCTSQQWLIINTTHSPEWKKQLYAIAYLDYVERISETFYE